MRTVSEIAAELVDASRELEAQHAYHLQLLEQAAAVQERVDVARDRCRALRLELEAPLDEATK